MAVVLFGLISSISNQDISREGDVQNGYFCQVGHEIFVDLLIPIAVDIDVFSSLTVYNVVFVFVNFAGNTQSVDR